MEDNLSSRTTTTLAEVVGRNQDLLSEILLRVPAKALLKFKCVSKQWLFLISDPKFCLSHTLHLFTHNRTPSALLLNNDYTSTPEFQIVHLKDNPKVPYLDYLNVPRIKLFQSCSGLLLCSSTYLRNPDDQGWKGFMSEKLFNSDHDYSSSVVTNDDKGVKYFICNPTTKQFKMIRYPRIKVGFLPTCFYLAFDPLKSPHYKVLSERLVGNGIFDIDIYFSETDSWNLKRYSFSIVSFRDSNIGVFLNGAIHWFCFGKESQYFDVDSETMKTYPMPPLDAGKMVNYFGESQGHLHLGVTNDFADLEFDIWELGMNYSGWFVKYHVNLQSMKMELSELVWDHGPHECPFRVLSLIRAQTEEESTLVLFMDRKAISYSFFYETSNNLCDLQPKPKPRSSRYGGYSLDYDKGYAFEYIETLVRV